MENSRRLDVLVGKRGFEPPFQSHRSDLCFWGLCYLIRQRTNTLRLCSPLCNIPVQQSKFQPIIYSSLWVLLDRSFNLELTPNIPVLGRRSFFLIHNFTSKCGHPIHVRVLKWGTGHGWQCRGGVMTAGRAQAHPYPHSRQICAV